MQKNIALIYHNALWFDSDVLAMLCCLSGHGQMLLLYHSSEALTATTRARSTIGIGL